MNITLSQNTVSPQKTQLQKRFEKLWRDVKNKQRANAKLKSELVALHKTYSERILPVEQLAEKPYAQLVQRLIVFFSRKSLAQWQRQALSQWILECIEHIQLLNSEKSDELMTSYHQTLADFYEIDVEELEAQINQSADPLFEHFSDLENAFHDSVDNEDDREKELQEDMFGLFGDEDLRATIEGLFSDDDRLEPPRAGNMLDDKWLRTIFRRTANALHPDKERNEALRKEKEGLMAQLLAARDEKDVFSLLNFYMQYVDSDDLLVTDETMENICVQLKVQKNHLAEERETILHENPVSAALYKDLHSRSKKKREKNIVRYVQSVQESTQALFEFVDSLRNLKVLKVQLEQRYGQHRVVYSDESPFEFNDF